MKISGFQNKKNLLKLENNEKWTLHEFDKILIDDTKNASKIKSSEYQNEGSYPIIDQGKSYISGYTNNESGLYTNTPCIIFGDHTKILKYIDFPIYIGADGVKVLKLNEEIDKNSINIKYLYYFLKTVELPTEGYSRHFKYLKQIIIPIPHIDIQNKITDILEKANILIDKRKEQIIILDQLIDSIFNNLIQIDVNKKHVKLVKVVNKISTGKSYSGEEESEYKVLKTSSISYNTFNENEVKNLPQGYVPENEHLVKKGDLLVSRMNTSELVGAAAYVNKNIDKVALPDRIWRLELNSNINPIYLWYCLNTFKFRSNVSRIASGTSGSMKNISQGRYLDLEITYIDIRLQNQFAEIVDKIEKEKKLLKQSLEELETNFKALEQKAFNGELFN